jgi:ABC-2 type transport system permease protein
VVTAQLRAELLRHRSIRTDLGLFGAMLGLVALVILLHGFGLPAASLARRSNQLEVLGQGQRLGTLFAALLGAVSMTVEFRHGTIRPTFLATPRRGPVLAAKVLVGMLIGVAFGVVAMAVAAALGNGALAARGVQVRLDPGDYALLLAGSAVGAALWAAIGVGFGAVVRNQVPTVVVICTWLLFVEGLLFGDVGLSDVGRFLPGSLAKAATGLDPQTLLAPGPAVLLLAVYAAAAAAVGWLATTRRDVA